MNVGILTFHRAINYGAYLQACGLCARLNQIPEINAEIIDYRMKKEKDFYSVNNRKYLYKLLKHRNYRFQKNLAKAFQRGYKDSIFNVSRASCVSDNRSDFEQLVNSRYDVLVVGSDEVWKLNGFRGFPNPYWLIGQCAPIKASYAASSRSDFSLLDKNSIDLINRTLNSFSYIGVRDTLTYNSIVDILGTAEKVVLCCDPSFIYDYKLLNLEISDLVNDRAFDLRKKTVLVMTENKNVAKKIRDDLKKEYNLISVFYRQSGYINAPNLTPMEWLTLISKVDFVVSSYFHGVCFSIVEKTPFIALGTERKKSKLSALLKDSPLETRFVFENEANNSDFNVLVENNNNCTGFREFVYQQRSTFDSFEEFLINLTKSEESK